MIGLKAHSLGSVARFVLAGSSQDVLSHGGGEVRRSRTSLQQKDGRLKSFGLAISCFSDYSTDGDQSCSLRKLLSEVKQDILFMYLNKMSGFHGVISTSHCPAASKRVLVETV